MLHSKWVNGNLVFWDTHKERWVDAIGPDVLKYINHFVSLPTDDATGDPTEWTATVVEVGAGNSTAVLGTAAGGDLILTTAGNDNDGIQIQLKGEAYALAADKPCYFGFRLTLSEATQLDFLAGLCITDTTLLGGMTDGVYFRKVDASTDVNFVTEASSTETATVEDTADTSVHIYEFFFDGVNCQPFVDGVAGTQVATNIPSTVLTPSIALLTGAASAETATIDWIRAIQIL